MSKVKRPDWRNPEDYARMDDLKPSQMAWEFLRRNPDYVEKWERYCDAICEISKNPNLSPVPDELVGAHEWGIENGYHDPEEDNPDIEWLPAVDSGFLMKIEDTPPTEKGHRWIGQLFPDEHGWIPIKFNIYNPIVPQIKAAKEELKRLQEEAKKRNDAAKKASKPRSDELNTPLRELDAGAKEELKRLQEEDKKVRKAFKPRRDEWITLLRVLDACAEKPKLKYKDIASIISAGIYEGDAGINWVYDKKEQALRYATRDYRLLPYSEK